MQSRRTALPQCRFFRSNTRLVLAVALFSLLGLAHAVQPNEREKLDLLSEELDEQTHKKVPERLEDLAEELDQTREYVAETSVLTTRSIETMLWGLHATKRTLERVSTRVAALESKDAAQELQSKFRAAEVRAYSMQQLHVKPVKETFQASSHPSTAADVFVLQAECRDGCKATEDALEECRREARPETVQNTTGKVRDLP